MNRIEPTGTCNGDCNLIKHAETFSDDNFEIILLAISSFHKVGSEYSLYHNKKLYGGRKSFFPILDHIPRQIDSNWSKMAPPIVHMYEGGGCS